MKQNTKLLLITLLLLGISFQTFASGISIAELDDLAEKVVGFFRSPFIISLVTITLMALGIALLMNLDNRELKRKLTIWLVAIGIIFGGPTIASQFVPSSGMLL